VSDTLRETADVETASDDYARRFAGPIGRWFLDEQTSATLALLSDLPAGATVLDVGGGHGQLAPALAHAGYQVLVVGSAAEAGQRLAAWVAAGQGRYQVADLLALPFADRSFDAGRRLMHVWHPQIRVRLNAPTGLHDRHSSKRSLARRIG
jgi:SAM-dependent methyltransferase